MRRLRVITALTSRAKTEDSWTAASEEREKERKEETEEVKKERQIERREEEKRENTKKNDKTVHLISAGLEFQKTCLLMIYSNEKSMYRIHKKYLHNF